MTSGGTIQETCSSSGSTSGSEFRSPLRILPLECALCSHSQSPGIGHGVAAVAVLAMDAIEICILRMTFQCHSRWWKLHDDNVKAQDAPVAYIFISIGYEHEY
ncbi:uncharacterized protein LOC117902350 [Drosophila subobscura]|uniref:uncharacterized protein LOC117902350 n=1 Tax=Drosophila subobscura TaxID=7241 RepID=UPI00155B3521|nr:uncharacterized protein LOC117902350 [Drosophila subobscura]